MKIDSGIGLVFFIGVYTLAPLFGYLLQKLTYDAENWTKWIRKVSFIHVTIGCLILVIGVKTVSYEFNQLFFSLFYLNVWVFIIQVLNGSRYITRTITRLFSVISVGLFGISGVTFIIPSLLFLNSVPQKYYIAEDMKRIEVYPQGTPLHPAGIMVRKYEEFGILLIKTEQLNFTSNAELKSELKIGED